MSTCSYPPSSPPQPHRGLPWAQERSGTTVTEGFIRWVTNGDPDDGIQVAQGGAEELEEAGGIQRHSIGAEEQAIRGWGAF